MQGKEDKLHATMENVKLRQRTMSLIENIKTVVEMKNLQAEEKVVHAQKIARQAQLDPLQENEE
jgi:hypothetical protein